MKRVKSNSLGSIMDDCLADKLQMEARDISSATAFLSSTQRCSSSQG